MWVKRTDEELLKARKDAKFWRMWRAGLFGLFISVMGIFFHGIGWSTRYATNRVPLDEIPSRILIAAPFGILISWTIYRFPSKVRRTMVCPHCGITKFEDSESKCSCGGHFEDLETMKWMGHKKHK